MDEAQTAALVEEMNQMAASVSQLTAQVATMRAAAGAPAPVATAPSAGITSRLGALDRLSVASRLSSLLAKIQSNQQSPYDELAKQLEGEIQKMEGRLERSYADTLARKQKAAADAMQTAEVEQLPEPESEETLKSWSVGEEEPEHEVRPHAFVVGFWPPLSSVVAPAVSWSRQTKIALFAVPPIMPTCGSFCCCPRHTSTRLFLLDCSLL